MAGVWYLSTRINMVELGKAFLSTSKVPVVLSIGVVVLTLVLKGWRWQLMFPSERPPVAVTSAFWAATLGQYVNLVVPFFRLGEIARLYALNQEAGIHPGKALGTLVVEKTLDLIFFGLTIIFIFPFLVLPDYVAQSGLSLFLLTVVLFVTLYILAYQTQLIIRLWRRIISPLPDRLQSMLLRLAVSGLEGLAALRDRRLSLLLLSFSLLIALLSIALPYLLFIAFDLPLSIIDAAVVHIVVSIAIVPPSTPAKLGILNGAAALALWQLGVADDTKIAGFAILYYLVAVIPQLLLGIVAASRTKWRWQSSIPSMTMSSNNEIKPQ